MNFTLSEIAIAVGNSTLSDLLGGLTVSEKQRVGTVIRIVGQFRYYNVTLNAQTFGRWGIHPATDDAITAAAVPDPLGDFRADWMWNDYYYADSSVAGEVQHQRFDIRSKRRIPSLSSLAFMMDVDPAANGSVEFSMAARLLYTVK